MAFTMDSSKLHVEEVLLTLDRFTVFSVLDYSMLNQGNVPDCSMAYCSCVLPLSLLIYSDWWKIS